MRCPDCNRFVSPDSPEPDVDLDIDIDGGISGTVYITVACPDCGTDLADYTFDIEADLSEVIEAHRAESPGCADSDLTIDDSEIARSEESRKRRTHQVISGTLQVRCMVCHKPVAALNIQESVANADMDVLI